MKVYGTEGEREREIEHTCGTGHQERICEDLFFGFFSVFAQLNLLRAPLTMGAPFSAVGLG